MGRTFTVFVSIFGGLVLTWMGGGMMAGAIRGTAVVGLREEDGGRRSLGAVFIGAAASASNPFWHVWWATVGMTYVVQAQNASFGMAGNAAFFTGHILSDLSWYCLVAFTIAFGRNFLSDRIYRILILICGISLIGIGLYFIGYGLGAR